MQLTVIRWQFGGAAAPLDHMNVKLMLTGPRIDSDALSRPPIYPDDSLAL